MPEAQRKIKVLIVDDIADTRDNLSKLLYFEPDIEVCGMATRGQEAIDLTKKLLPDIVLMDINMPDMDGITATKAIVAQVPGTAVIMMSVQGDQDYLRRSMLAGAREFLVKPFSGDELISSIHQLYNLQSTQTRPKVLSAQQEKTAAATNEDQGKVYLFFSPKGGVGRTTIATNLAISAKLQTGKRVALVDASVYFGDIAVMLNLSANKTISDLVPRLNELDADLLSDVMTVHSSGIKVLLAPAKPEEAELIKAEHFKKILGEMRKNFDYIFIDGYPSFDDNMLSLMDIADRILVIVALEMPSIKDAKLFLDVNEKHLNYPAEKIFFVLNRADTDNKMGLRIQQIEDSLHYKMSAKIVSDGVEVTKSVNFGVPLVIRTPTAQFSKDITAFCNTLLNPQAEAATVNAKDNNKDAPKDAGRKDQKEEAVPGGKFTLSRFLRGATNK